MSSAKKTAQKTEEMTRKIWLAGLGAYGQGLDSLQHGYEKMSDQAREYFEELVSRGEQLEKETRSGVSKARKKITDQAVKNRELIIGLKDRVSGNKDELLEELQTRIGKLTETLSKLVKPAEPAKKAPAKKAVAKKTPARRATAKKAAETTAAAKRTRTTRKPAAAADATPKATVARKPRARKVAAPQPVATPDVAEA